MEIKQLKPKNIRKLAPLMDEPDNIIKVIKPQKIKKYDNMMMKPETFYKFGQVSFKNSNDALEGLPLLRKV